METDRTGVPAYDVLSPWADADPVPVRGIVPRLDGLEGRMIGLFVNSKRAAPIICDALETRLKERAPSLQVSRYTFTTVNVPEVQTENRAKFEAWVQGVDAVVLAVGD